MFCISQGLLEYIYIYIPGQRVCGWISVHVSIFDTVQKSSQTINPIYIQHLYSLPSATAPCCQCMENKKPYWQQDGLFGNFHGTPLANHLIRCNPILALKLFVGQRQTVRTLIPPLFGNTIQIAFMMYLFQKNSTELGFHFKLQMYLNFSCHFPYFLSTGILIPASSIQNYPLYFTFLR